MIIPVRCFTCGKVIGDLYESYVSEIEMGGEPSKVLESLGLDRFCCRKTILTHADLIDEVINYG